jgi:hypothetical protein
MPWSHSPEHEGGRRDAGMGREAEWGRKVTMKNNMLKEKGWGDETGKIKEQEAPTFSRQSAHRWR